MPRRLSHVQPKIYAFIDASNLFYGGVKSLGWKIDYQKLARYLKQKYHVSKLFYYAGIELNGYRYSPLDGDIPIEILHSYFERKVMKSPILQGVSPPKTTLQRIKFYRKLQEFGFTLKLKPVKVFRSGQGIVKKANCDVDMTFDIMRLYSQYSQAVILSGDGDFYIVLKYLIEKGKNITILARSERTAREIRQLAGNQFRDFTKLRKALEFIPKK